MRTQSHFYRTSLRTCVISHTTSPQAHSIACSSPAPSRDATSRAAPAPVRTRVSTPSKSMRPCQHPRSARPPPRAPCHGNSKNGGAILRVRVRGEQRRRTRPSAPGSRPLIGSCQCAAAPSSSLDAGEPTASRRSTVEGDGCLLSTEPWGFAARSAGRALCGPVASVGEGGGICAAYPDWGLAGRLAAADEDGCGAPCVCVALRVRRRLLALTHRLAGATVASRVASWKLGPPLGTLSLASAVDLAQHPRCARTRHLAARKCCFPAPGSIYILSDTHTPLQAGDPI